MQRTIQKKKLLIVEVRTSGESLSSLSSLIGALGASYELSLAVGSAGKEISTHVSESHLPVLPLMNSGKGFIGGLRLIRELYLLNRIHHFDIVHVMGESGAFTSGIAAFTARVPKIVLSIERWRFVTHASPLRKWSAAVASKCAAYFFHHIIFEREGDFNLALAYHIAPPRKLLVAGPPPLSGEGRDKILWAYRFTKA